MTKLERGEEGPWSGCGHRRGRRYDKTQGADSHLGTKVTETNALEMSPLCRVYIVPFPTCILLNWLKSGHSGTNCGTWASPRIEAAIKGLIPS